MTRRKLDGSDPDPHQLRLLDLEKIPHDPNPMVRAYGKAEGFKCRDCRFLTKYKMANVWYKCALRTPGGPATDHRRSWNACRQIETP